MLGPVSKLAITRRISATLDGIRVPVEARFRLPQKVAAGGYRCVCELRTDQGSRMFSINGRDGVQALVLAFTFIAMELRAIARARGLKIPRHELADLLCVRLVKGQRTRSSSRSPPTKRSR
jgi:hypothetical protein